MPSPFPSSVQMFVATHVRSVSELELLLLLRDEPARAWTAEQAATRLSHSPDWASAQLERFVAAKLAVGSPLRPRSYRFAPADLSLERCVDAVAEAFRTRRSATVNLIYAEPRGPERLSDAFRLRRDG